MSIDLLPEPTGGAPLGVADYNYQNALQQALHGMGSHNDILTEWDTTTEPEIAVGARFVHDGGLYECQTADEAIGGAPDDGHVYIKVVEAVGVITATFVNVDTGYTFDPIKGGFYHADGSQLLPYILLKYNSTYWKKTKALTLNLNDSDTLSNCQIYPWAGMEAIVQDDSKDSLLLPAGTTYFPFSSPNLVNSDNIVPTVRHNIEWKDKNDGGAKHPNRGITYFNSGYCIYNHTIGDEMTFYFRLKPDWAYNCAALVPILSFSGLLSSGDNRAIFYYDNVTDKFAFYIRRIAANTIGITSDAFLSDVTLQIDMDIVIRWSETSNDADVWINGVQQGGGVEGTKTITGTLAGLNLNKTFFTIGAYDNNDNGVPTGFELSTFYLTDLMIMDTSNITYKDNYDGGTVYPYYETEYLSGIDHGWQIQADGSAGFKNVSGEKGIFGSIDIGAGQIKMKKIAIGAWDMDATSAVNVTHGLDYTKIFAVDTLILTDAGTPYVKLDCFSDFADPFLLNGGIKDFSGGAGTAITLSRRAGGTFDGVNFDSVTVNRGYIYIWYEA